MTTKTNTNGITAIYVRRSVSDKDRGNNTLSIAAQKEECVKFAGKCDYQIYCNDGKSGKDIGSPSCILADDAGRSQRTSQPYYRQEI